MEISKLKYDHLVFVGGILDEKYQNEIFEKIINFLPNSADILQKNIINGMLKNGINDLTIINSKYVGSYPKYYKNICIKKNYTFYSKNENVKLIDTGFINLPIINTKSRFCSLKKAITDNFGNNEKILFIVYSLLPHNALIINYLKKTYPNSKILIIITDFPQYMRLDKYSTKLSISYIYHKIFNAINKKTINTCLQQADFYVLLTKYMKDLIPKVCEKKVLIIEGAIDVDEYDRQRLKKKETDLTRIITYTGALEYSLGIIDLLEAFSILNEKNCQLNIIGDGLLRDTVIQYSKKNNNIKYLGKMSKKDTISMQLKSDILVCPTKIGEACSKYAFPCKLIEYLYTGNIVVSNKLECIPKEYDKYIRYTKDGSIKSIAQAIKSALNTDINYNFNQINWIKENKSVTRQVQKLLKFINEGDE